MIVELIYRIAVCVACTTSILLILILVCVFYGRLKKVSKYLFAIFIDAPIYLILTLLSGGEK